MAVVILTRSSAYIFSKTGLETLGTFNLLAARFLLAFLVLGVIFFKRAKSLADFFDTLKNRQHHRCCLFVFGRANFRACCVENPGNTGQYSRRLSPCLSENYRRPVKSSYFS